MHSTFGPLCCIDCCSLLPFTVRMLHSNAAQIESLDMLDIDDLRAVTSK